MAKQYQSIGGVVNEPSDAQREYQTTTAVVQSEDVATVKAPPIVPFSRRVMSGIYVR